MNNYSVLFSSDIFPFLFVKLSRLSSTILHQQILSPLLLLLLIYLTCAVLCLFTQSCPTLCNPMECSLPDILAQGDSPGKNNGGGSLSLLQGIFLTQESNQDLLHCRRILYQLSYQGSPHFLHAAAAVLLQSCPTVRPQRLQPTRLPCPWDSPGKNTGVGCHFLLQCRRVKSESEVAQSCPTLHDPMDCSLPGSSVHGICQARVLEWGAIAFSDFLHNDTQNPKYVFA